MEKFVKAEMEIIKFDTSNILTASTCPLHCACNGFDEIPIDNTPYDGPLG